MMPLYRKEMEMPVSLQSLNEIEDYDLMKLLKREDLPEDFKNIIKK